MSLPFAKRKLINHITDKNVENLDQFKKIMNGIRSKENKKEIPKAYLGIILSKKKYNTDSVEIQKTKCIILK